MGLTQVDGGDGLKKPIDLVDNEKVRFGTGGDLQIFHNGTHNVINGAAGQNLEIQTNAFRVKNQANTEAMIIGQANGAVQLFHDNNEKLITKSDGVNITGELECDSLDVDGNGDVAGTLSVNKLFVRDNGANSPIVSIRTDDGSPWAFSLGNDGYSTNDEHGLRMYQSTDGSVNITNSGNNAWERININQQVGGSTETGIQIGTNRAVSLMYQGNTKLFTTSSGVDVTGTVTCDGLTSDGVINCASGVGQVNIQDTNNSGTGCQAEINFKESDGTTQGYIGYANTNSSTFFIANVESNAGITFLTQNVSRVSIQGDGHLVPQANNTYDLGTSSNRWRNVYTNDLNLSNEGSTNDVDGTWGSYTIQEGEDDLFLINRRNGKKYKFNLTEVN